VRLEEAIGQRIRIGRDAHQWSQGELGKQLEPYLGRSWTRQAVSAAEKGGRDFGASELVALASVLGVHVGWLFTTDAAEIELPGRTITGPELYERLAERPEVGNQRRVGDSLDRLHSRALEGLEGATEALQDAGEYVKWLRSAPPEGDE